MASEFEERVNDWLVRQQDMVVLRKGWPDFLCYDGTYRHPSRDKTFEGVYRGKIFCVEAKTETDKVSPHQRQMHEVLIKAGIPVHVVRPDALTKGKYPRARMLFHETHLQHSVDKVEVLQRQVQDLEWKLEKVHEELKHFTFAFEEVESEK
ncbi:MAG: VRR-NUC domain-containing protein [Chloroflexi bacterium]|jgi:hypothetical protein|nr:MAG: VRR-NUC domain-containing protein [Chloroflexota bacterium]|tara:strand:+ start:692 stop:1144 length:453 start_codon:yes stop_codon:yes gene_type:complete